jgi:molybdopterin-guanine dinucleotide biosynthesis protein A
VPSSGSDPYACEPGATAEYDAVVLAGGGASRMGGADKTALTVDGVPLLDRVLSAVADARTLIVVGEPRPTRLEVTRAGMALVHSDRVVLLAADLPFLSCDAVARLLAAVGESGAVLVDADGREQWLAGAWRTDVLGTADLRPGGSLRHALTPLRPNLVAALGTEVIDCDTAEDLARARGLT